MTKFAIFRLAALAVVAASAALSSAPAQALDLDRLERKASGAMAGFMDKAREHIDGDTISLKRLGYDAGGLKSLSLGSGGLKGMKSRKAKAAQMKKLQAAKAKQAKLKKLNAAKLKAAAAQGAQVQ